MKKRKSKETDEENCKKAYDLLINLIKSHQEEIESVLWVGPMIAALAETFQYSEIPFEYFKEEMIKCIDHYKY